MVMNVSLCGPHSFETLTFVPTTTEELAPAAPRAIPLWMNWYFCHQVGSCEFGAAATGSPTTRESTAEKRTRMVAPSRAVEHAPHLDEHNRKVADGPGAVSGSSREVVQALAGATVAAPVATILGISAYYHDSAACLLRD